ncbi:MULTISPECIES: hypothetical protein [Bradyrhizobium]|jgi:hypothetical protein|uniref:hypothetical protein n=1 Tax=Bradyrhizobium TaxID=374 RepID=UPI0012BD7C7C|nr:MULTISPECIES: hypothetical protein [Bradyrhizobium]MCS3450071.1 hypothetical protein [Bradyrhizobium elkanii]MCS3558784.1 hypothetical protein [Bradyrhizobium elkanii]MCW2151368.1 hypothetical protein [Bradyrhizobium elkanii]MCW2358759.1 hypothetical protein [Bradyrhizobium elkanii]MCW2375099.1 hypothetical protein [Bradyrhizobium elkanii]
MIQPDHAPLHASLPSPPASSRARERGVILPHTLRSRRAGAIGAESPKPRFVRKSGSDDLKRGKTRLTHENFFVAKNYDSASATRRFSSALATQRNDGRASIARMRIQEKPTTEGVSCNVDKCRCRRPLRFLHRRANDASI